MAAELTSEMRVDGWRIGTRKIRKWKMREWVEVREWGGYGEGRLPKVGNLVGRREGIDSASKFMMQGDGGKSSAGWVTEREPTSMRTRLAWT